MSWLKKIKQWARFRRNDDAYATTREKLWQGVKEAVATQLAFGRSIWLVAHFPDTFIQLQEQVDQWGVGYSIARQPITIESLAGPNKDLISEGSIHLVLADLVPTHQASSDQLYHGNVAAMVVERHPWGPRDVDLCRYFKTLTGAGLSVELGYFLAFDDPVVASVLSETTIEVLNQLGLATHSLINSTALTRRIERQLKRQQTLYHDETETDNVQLWFESNRLEPPV